jgi:hypothetical protein
MLSLELVPQAQSSKKQLSNPKWIKVEWRWSKHGEFYRVACTVLGEDTARMFRVSKRPPTMSEWDYIVYQAELAVKDVIDKFELKYKIHADVQTPRETSSRPQSLPG